MRLGTLLANWNFPTCYIAPLGKRSSEAVDDLCDYPGASQFEVVRMLHDLSAAIEINDATAVRRIIRNRVAGFHVYRQSPELVAAS